MAAILDGGTTEALAAKFEASIHKSLISASGGAVTNSHITGQTDASGQGPGRGMVRVASERGELSRSSQNRRRRITISENVDTSAFAADFITVACTFLAAISLW